MFVPANGMDSTEGMKESNYNRSFIYYALPESG